MTNHCFKDDSCPLGRETVRMEELQRWVDASEQQSQSWRREELLSKVSLARVHIKYYHHVQYN